MIGQDAKRPPSFVTVWIVPIVCAVAFSALVGFLASRYGDWSFSVAFSWTLVAILGTAAWFLGTYVLYETAAKRLGWQCATGPQLTADGRSVVGDIVIRGEHRGRPFTLTRVKSTSTGRRTVFSSTVEWTGQDIRIPSFLLHLTSAMDASLSRVTGTGAMAEALSSALFPHRSSPRVGLDESTRLARRASLTAPDAAAALAYFNPTRCEALDALVTTETLEGEPGRFVIHASGFPLPWQLETFLARLDEVRGVLMA